MICSLLLIHNTEVIALFFSNSSKCQQFSNPHIQSILEDTFLMPGALLILDIDDTIGRVSQTIGLDAWFRFRIEQHITEGHSDSDALAKTLVIYNLAQLASPKMVPVDKSKPIAPLIKQLQARGVKIIGLTARNHKLTDKTLSFLKDLDIAFCENVIEPGEFSLNDKPVIIQKGIIFANGNNKGLCIESLHKKSLFTMPIRDFNHISFVDDSKRNCEAVANSLEKLGITSCTAWHYNYAELHLNFDQAHQARSIVQEAHLLAHNQLLTDEEVDTQLSLEPTESRLSPS